MSDRTDLNEIRTQFQVAEEPLIQYHPRLMGMVDIPGTHAVELTETEGTLIDRMVGNRGLPGLFDLKGTYDLAFSESKARYPNNPLPAGIPEERSNEWQQNDGHRDAYRHAYWNALLGKEFGDDWATAFATAHEGRPGNPANREAMDLYNNQIGRAIAIANPHASKEELATLVGGALQEGRLVLMDSKGQLAWSDQVAVGQHGLSPNEVIQAQRNTPEIVPSESSLRGRSNSSSAADDAPFITPDKTGHPRHSLHQQCSAGVDALDQQLGRPSDQSSACMKASLTTLAATNGFERVDHVLLSRNSGETQAGQNVFIVQGDPRDPTHLRAHMPTGQAVNTPVDVSFRELAQVDQQQAQLQATQVMTPQQDAFGHGARTMGA
ncbi:XVIPCD domain-containing protein [Pseudoxanthomonas sp.]|uniref:XVIPCD domain-containing protein n=1 Tax=Pseudoxanthomonas sp. TaxID=1871049 RepID=UPI002610F9DD|nr:XVIPCD domain-containing protein [Pseudoxanthomonas sp.]WDS34958.1 MAG: hypothetical protein O8I58_11275 [Pseudoxanthomonas sp.]